MKFTIMSQKLAETSDGNGKFLISITDPEKPKPAFVYKWNDILRLEFEDLCPDECKSIGRGDLLINAQLFSENDAVKILDFIAKVAKRDDNAEVVVHCKMGVSRSAAVALFLAEKFGEITNPPEYIKKHCRPNPYVIKTLAQIYNASVSKETN